MFRSYFLLVVYFTGCRQLTKTSSPVIYHIMHFILAANLVDNLRKSKINLLSPNPIFYLQNEQLGNLIYRQIISFFSFCCHHMSDFKAKMHQIQIGLGLRPTPRWGSLHRSLNPQLYLRGSTSRGGMVVGRGRQGTGGEG